MKAIFDKVVRHNQRLVSDPHRLRATAARFVRQLSDPEDMGPAFACLLLTLAFLVSWVTETLVIGSYFRIDPYTPLIVFWSLRAPRVTAVAAILYAGLMLETAAARPMGIVIGPYLSAFILLTAVRDSLAMSSPKMWCVLILLASGFVALFEWTVFLLLSSLSTVAWADFAALGLRVLSALFFAVAMAIVPRLGLLRPGPKLVRRASP